MRTLIALLLLPSVAFGQSNATSFALGMLNEMNRRRGYESTPEYNYNLDFRAQNEWRQHMALMKAQQQYLEQLADTESAKRYHRSQQMLNDSIRGAQINESVPPGFE